MFASLSGSQLKQAFVLTGSFADRYPGVGPEGLPQESRSRCPEPRQETPWSWANTECITHRALCRTGGSILNQGNPRRGPGTIRRTGWHLPAFLKEFKGEAGKLLIGAISDV